MKLFVAGCSFSDYTKVSKVYGDFLAEKLNCQYMHTAIGNGSNYRIWREVVNCILSGKLTSDDLLIVQYSNIHRNEFWFNKEKSSAKEDEYDDGVVARFKMNSYSWQTNSTLKDFFQTYENHCINSNFEKEKFIVNHTMFQTLLCYFKIKTLFLETAYIDNNLMLLPELFKIQWNKQYSELELALFSRDMAHLSPKGHETLAQDLYEHLIKVKII